MCFMSPSGCGSVNEVAVIRSVDIDVNMVANCVSVYYFPLRNKNNEVRKMDVQKIRFETTK